MGSRADRIGVVVLVAALAVVSQFLGEYHLALLTQITIFALSAMGLNILLGNTGMISIAHAAFMGVGAFSSAYLIQNLGFPALPAILLAGLITSVVGMVFGLPSLRLKGVYLAMASFAAQIILYWAFEQSRWLTGGQDGRFAERPMVLGIDFMDSHRFYLFALGITVLGAVANLNILRSRMGRAFTAVRDHSLAAEMMGVNPFRVKMASFGLATFYAGVAGALFGQYLEFVAIQAFSLTVSIQFLALVIIGGLGSLAGSVLGAAFIVLVPEILDALVLALAHNTGEMAPIRLGVFGLIVVVFSAFRATRPGPGLASRSALGSGPSPERGANPAHDSSSCTVLRQRGFRLKHGFLAQGGPPINERRVFRNKGGRDEKKMVFRPGPDRHGAFDAGPGGPGRDRVGRHIQPHRPHLGLGHPPHGRSAQGLGLDQRQRRH